MNVKNKPQRLFGFLKNNWFKLSLVLLVLYVWFQKDLSFQVSFDEPGKTEQKATQVKEKLTEADLVHADRASVIEKLEFPFIGNSMSGRDGLSELAKIPEEVRRAYLERFAKVAMAEQQKFGIPASVILGTALYQSSAGRRQVAIEGNNQFALFCTANWSGVCLELQGRRYRKYETAWESFRDFSLFANENFASLKGGDYKAWAKGMGKASFSGSDDFSKSLIGVIENYGLQELDK